MRPRRKRVAILGGGCAGVAAAHALSRTPALRRAFVVTVYEQSWRLGGKGATGRDPEHGHRIEEHGLHVWMGFYDHAFAAVRECLDAWDPPPACPLQRFEDAFAPQYAFSVGDWRLQLPQRPGRPGDPRPHGWSAFAESRFAIQMLAALARGRAPWARAHGIARLAGVVLRGLTAEAFGRGDVWQRMDAYDLRAWLIRHGASATTANAPVIRALYDMAFAYPDGVAGNGRGAVAAGAAVRSILRLLLTYQGAPMWKLRFGMGDTAFAPMHEVLRRRGVTFRFLHRTERLVPSDSTNTIDAVEMTSHDDGHHNDPLITVGGLPCWPRAPRRRRGAARKLTLRHGDDFDDLILAIPSGALRPLLTDVARRHRPIATMLEHTHTVATKAAQLWTQQPIPAQRETVTGTAGPFATMADLSEVLTAEAWPTESAPRGLLYLVDTMPDANASEAVVAADARSWLEHVGPGLLGEPIKLAAPPYVRANVEGWERYVLTLPGTTRFRIAPDQTGVNNLRICGDWVQTSINGGSVEAAFESATVAAASLAG